MAQRVFKLVQPCGVVLMHDGRIPSRWKDVKALPLIIEGLQKRGYKFVTVSELFRLTRSPSKPLISHWSQSHSGIETALSLIYRIWR